MIKQKISACLETQHSRIKGSGPPPLGQCRSERGTATIHPAEVAAIQVSSYRRRSGNGPVQPSVALVRVSHLLPPLTGGMRFENPLFFQERLNACSRTPAPPRCCRPAARRRRSRRGGRTVGAVGNASSNPLAADGERAISSHPHIAGENSW